MFCTCEPASVEVFSSFRFLHDFRATKSRLFKDKIPWHASHYSICCKTSAWPGIHVPLYLTLRKDRLYMNRVSSLHSSARWAFDGRDLRRNPKTDYTKLSCHYKSRHVEALLWTKNEQTIWLNLAYRISVITFGHRFFQKREWLEESQPYNSEVLLTSEVNGLEFDHAPNCERLFFVLRNSNFEVWLSKSIQQGVSTIRTMIDDNSESFLKMTR